MTTFIAIFILNLTALTNSIKETTQEASLISTALDRCTHIRKTSWSLGSPPRFLLLGLLRIENEYNPPKEWRGFILAAACVESGFNPSAKGDHKYSKRKRPVAVGILQQWPWVEKRYRIDRTNPAQAAHAFMKHIVEQLKKTRKHCRTKNKFRIWKISEVRSVRASPLKCLRKKKKLTKREKMSCHRCFQASAHYRLFVKWRRGRIR